MFSVEKAVNPVDEYWRMVPALVVPCNSDVGADADVAIELAGMEALLGNAVNTKMDSFENSETKSEIYFVTI